jgi:Spy/CpxP family protein refolding chaperone
MNLTAEQKDRITAIQDAAGEEMRQLFQAGAGGDRDEMRKKATELRDSTNQKTRAVLTPEQETKWKELVGEPFKGEIRPPQRGANRAA